MNCQEFELIAGELASDQLMSAKTRVNALAHARTCASCASCLANERMLEANLISLADSTAAEAPARLKQSLRAAFDAQYAKPAAAPNVIQMPVRTNQWRWALAAAAAVVVFLAVAGAIWQRGQFSKTKELVLTTSPTPVLHPVAPDPTPEPVRMQLANHNKIKERAMTNRLVPARQRLKSSRREEGEVAANYIPLTYSAHSGFPQDKLVVRVDVPRSTLISMGLPLNAERGNEMVKADLMVGVDGVPLAIRFVRQ